MRVLGYLDAGTGSMIASAVAGVGAGVVVLFLTFKNKILGVVSPKRRHAAAEAKAASAATGASETTEATAASEQG